MQIGPKYILLFFLFGIISQYSIGQLNLVPNSSFEDTNQCPDGEYINYATGWSSYGLSPELYHPCANNQWNAPHSYIGYQNAATGVAFAGLIAYQRAGISNKEFIGGQLSQSLIIGQKYFVSFKASLPKKNPSVTNQNDCAVYACNKLGILFTTVAFSSTTPPPTNNFSHFYSDSIITDTLNWITVSGSFIADSAYDHLILGVFFDTNNVDTIRLFQPDCDFFAYYFIDDICVSTDSMTCYQYIGIDESKLDPSRFNIFPNPSVDYFTINDLLNESYSIIIYNTIGQELYRENNLNEFNNKIDIQRFEKGLLFIQVKTKNQSVIYKFLHT
jgi:hypothetical protein